MALTQSVAPAIEPVTLGEAKSFLRVDGTHDDAVITSLITTSRLHIETALDLALISQTWVMTAPAPLDGELAVPLWPIGSLTVARWRLSDGSAREIELASLELASAERPAHVSGFAVPLEADARVEIEFQAGFGASADAVPAPIRHALQMLIAHWYENREPVMVGTSATKIPQAVSNLLAPYRWVQL